MRDQGEDGGHSPLQGYMTFLDTLHIEANRRDGVDSKLSSRQNSQQRSLASVLQPDHGNVHLSRPEQAEQPVVDAAEEVRHGRRQGRG